MRVKSPSRQFSQSQFSQSLARFKTTSRQFCQSNHHACSSAIEPVTVQQDLRQPVDSSVRFQSPSRQFNYIQVNQSKIPLNAVQPEPVDNSATLKISSRRISWILLTIQPHLVHLIEISQNHLNPVKILQKEVISTQNRPILKKICGPV